MRAARAERAEREKKFPWMKLKKQAAKHPNVLVMEFAELQKQQEEERMQRCDRRASHLVASTIIRAIIPTQWSSRGAHFDPCIFFPRAVRRARERRENMQRLKQLDGAPEGWALGGLRRRGSCSAAQAISRMKLTSMLGASAGVEDAVQGAERINALRSLGVDESQLLALKSLGMQAGSAPAPSGTLPTNVAAPSGSEAHALAASFRRKTLWKLL